MEWVGLPPEHRSWEDIDTIKRLMTEGNLEDKINLDGGGDVTVNLDLDIVIARLREDLGISEEEATNVMAEDNTNTG